jgi:hypothetical protein
MHRIKISPKAKKLFLGIKVETRGVKSNYFGIDLFKIVSSLP